MKFIGAWYIKQMFKGVEGQGVDGNVSSSAKHEAWTSWKGEKFNKEWNMHLIERWKVQQRMNHAPHGKVRSSAKKEARTSWKDDSQAWRNNETVG